MGDPLTKSMVSPKVIRTMRGLGDTIYQRAFIPDGYVDTPWPELFEDRFDVLCVQPETELRTQAKNVTRVKRGWAVPPKNTEVKQIHYGPSKIAINKNIIRALESQLPGPFLGLDLPEFDPSPVQGKYAILKPNTVRSEWACPARNCKSEYLNDAAAMLMDAGYDVIGVADLKEGEEWIDGPPPFVNEYFYEGEINVKELVSLVRGASVVVSSVGWPVPMCLAAGTKLVCIGGGLGRFNRANVITDPRLDLSNFHFIEPDNYCMCSDMKHKCDKHISGFGDKFVEAIR